MYEGYKIKEGDFVNVYLESKVAFFEYEVLGTPAATGDAWKLKGDDGNIIYVQNYLYMEKLDERNQ